MPVTLVRHTPECLSKLTRAAGGPNPNAAQIGEELDQQRGFALMRRGHETVAVQGGQMHARIFESYWDNIGEWLS